MGNNQYCYERTSKNKMAQKKYNIDLYQLNQIVELGNTSFQNQDYKQALQHYYEALDGFKIAHDPKHPNIAMTLNNIALVYKQQQDYQNALDIYTEALYLYTSKTVNQLNQNDEYEFEVGIIVNNIGLINTYMNNNEQAILCFKLAYFISKKKDSQKSKLVGILNNLGLTYMNLKQYEKSFKYFKQCIENDLLQSDISICKSVYDLEDSDLLKSDILNNLGIVSEHLQKFDESIKYYHQAIQIYKQEEKLPQIAKVLNNMVSLYQQREDFDEAFDCCQKSLDIRLQCFGEESTETLESYQNLATLYEHQQDYKNALRIYYDIKNIREQHFPYDNLQLAKILSSIAINHIQTKQFDQALQIQLQALDLRQQKISSNFVEQFDLAENLYNVGFIYKNMKDYKTSSYYFKQAIDILNKNEKQNLEHIISIYQNESQNQILMQNKKEGIQCLQTCLQILEKNDLKDSNLYKELNENIKFTKRQSESNTKNIKT